MLKLSTIRRDGSIEVLSRNLAVKVLIEKSACIEPGAAQRTLEEVNCNDLNTATLIEPGVSGAS